MAGTGAVLGAAGLSSTVGADDSIPVEIANVYPIEDVVILENVGEEAVDLGAYEMHWGMNLDQDQIDRFDSGTTIAPEQQLSVWTGFQSTQIDDVEADVQIADHDNGRINAEEPNTLGLVAPSGDVVDRTDDTVADDPAYDSGEYDEADPAEDEDDEPVSQDVEFEYEYVAELHDRDDVDLESKLELSSAEYYRATREDDRDHCFVEVEAENLTDDEEINVYYAATVEGVGSVDSTGLLAPGETVTVRLPMHECPEEDPAQGVVSAMVTIVRDYDGEDEDPEDGEDEDEPDDDPAEEEPEDEEPEEEERDDDPEKAEPDDEDEKDRDDEKDVKQDDDCPDDEDGTEAKTEETRSDDEDCPEEEPEPTDEEDC
ncbi:hypothetical protein [Natronococcus roseus]|uniref:hypothetical protein n=1 Tax=Natronococcus roseus TaxID=1052014 RepID=UPI00374CCBFD